MYYIIFYLAEELFIKVSERWVSSKYRHKLSRYCKYIYIFPSTFWHGQFRVLFTKVAMAAAVTAASCSVYL